MYTLSCVFFLLPRKKLKWWHIAAAVLIIISGYYFMRAEYRAQNILTGAVLEFCVLVLPPALLCKGDPWRNILIRMIFQLVCNVLYYIETTIYTFIISKVFPEKWYDGMADVSLEGQLINVAFTLGKVTAAWFIMRGFVKRWDIRHRRIYVWIVSLYLIAGLVTGLIRMKADPMENGYSVEFYSLMLIAANLAMIGLISAIYTGAEKARLKKENSWYEERIKMLTGSLTEKVAMKEYIRDGVKRLEAGNITVNCLEMEDRSKISPELEMLMDRFFGYIQQSAPERADITVQGGHGYKGKKRRAA